MELTRLIAISCELQRGQCERTKVNIEVSSSETVADLKRSLFDKFGISEADESDFSLICGSKVMEHLDQRLSDTEIGSDQDAKVLLVHGKVEGDSTAVAKEVEKPDEIEKDSNESEEVKEDKKSWWWGGGGQKAQSKGSGLVRSSKDFDSSDENSPNNMQMIISTDQCSTSPAEERNKGFKFGNRNQWNSNKSSSNGGGSNFFNSRWLGGGGGGSNYSFNSDEIRSSPHGVAGLVGLGNLGNTCYMNSSLQCLLHTHPLMKCFLSNEYKRFLNRNNPLGQKGELAEAFAALMSSVWTNGVSHVAPRGFKSKIGSFSSTFSGYGQQDSQELLAFLMDGLHEDLNRVLEKPYVKERDDVDKLPDDELARVTWEGHLLRNDSIIVDHCLGMYRSTLTCPTCHKTSKKFDPVMYLSLPLPESKVKSCKILVIMVDGSKAPTKYSIDVPSISSIKDLINSLAAVAGLEVAPSSSLSTVGSTVSLDGLANQGRTSEPSQSLPRAEDIICLTKFKDASYSPELTLLPLKSRVSEHMPSSSQHNYGPKEFFVAYIYPSASQGPRNEDLTPVIVFQSSAKSSYYSSNYVSIPALIFAPKPYLSVEDLEKFKCQYDDSCYQIKEESMIFKTIERAFAPLLPDREPPPLLPPDKEPPLLQTPPATAAPDQEMQDAPPTPAHIPIYDNNNDRAQDNINPDIEASSSARVASDVPAFEPSPPSPVPFDMFSDQAPPPPSPQPCPFKLFVSMPVSSRGPEKRFRSYDNDDPLTTGMLILEWQHGKEPPMLLEEHASFKEALERGKEGRRPVNLHACFEAFLQPEQLGEDDSWYCPHCKEHVQADKKLDLWTLPEVLVIHLKRFYFTRSSRDKLTTKVDFPLRGLDLSSYLLRPETDIPPIYDCYAVSNHFGSMGGGHYTAYAKCPDSDSWHLFDDSHVNSATEDEVVSSAAYVLFYRRRHEASRDAAVARSQPVASAPDQNGDDVDMAGGLEGGLEGRLSGVADGQGDEEDADVTEPNIIREVQDEDLDDLEEPAEIKEEDEEDEELMSTSP